MILSTAIQWSLPLKNPVLIFSLILFIILFAPIILNRLKIPPLIGLIVAGAIIGPNAFYLLPRDSSIVLFGTVGLLYIMFLAGLEIDLADFKKNSGKSIVFGMYTFLIPMSLGTLAGYYLLAFTIPTSVLLASMFASHTLVAYPIIGKFGITKNRAVSVAVGGTLITDTLALLVLAVIAGMSTGVIDNNFWIRLGISVVVFGVVVLVAFPIIGRWFFKRFDDSVSQYIFVLGMVFLGSFLAELAGIEAIIGAFLAGLALNRLIPRTSPLMNRIEFVGNALFIPFFLIGVGMLIDYRVFFTDLNTIFVGITMTVIATFSKFTAAWLTQKTFRFSVDERRIIFGLSNAQAAATLAAVMVGFNIILGYTEDGEPIRLLNENVLNGSILMILATCTIASFTTQKGAQNIAINEAEYAEEDSSSEERILIPLNNPENIEELIGLGITIKSKSNKSGLYALNVIDNNDTDSDTDKKARKKLEKAAHIAAAADNHLHQLLRFDLNVVNGVTSIIKEHKITDLILGLHHKKGISASFLGNLTEGILTKSNATTFIYKPTQPLSTINRHLVIVPENAEREPGFAYWLVKMWNIGRNTGARFRFYAPASTLGIIKNIHQNHPIESDFQEFTDWDDFLILSRDVRIDDNLTIVMSRKNHPSYQNTMVKIPDYLNKYFLDNSFLLIYPVQLTIRERTEHDLSNLSLLEPIEKLDDLGKTIAKLFRKK